MCKYVCCMFVHVCFTNAHKSLCMCLNGRMFLCVRVFVYVCMCVCRQPCVRTCVACVCKYGCCMCVHMYVTHAEKRLCMCVCARMFFCVSVCVQVCMCVRRQPCAYVCADVCACVCLSVRTCVHVCACVCLGVSFL